MNHFFCFSIIAQKNRMIQVAWREQALKNKQETNSKPTKQKMLLFKVYTLKFEFHRHLEHMVSYQGMQSGLPVCLLRKLGTFEIFMLNDCLVKPDFSYFSNYKHQK